MVTHLALHNKKKKKNMPTEGLGFGTLRLYKMYTAKTSG